MDVVRDGEVEIRCNDPVLETVGPDEIFGELAIIDHSPRSAEARAKTACTIAPVDKRRFEFRVQEHPFFATKVMKVMAARLRRAT